MGKFQKVDDKRLYIDLMPVPLFILICICVFGPIRNMLDPDVHHIQIDLFKAACSWPVLGITFKRYCFSAFRIAGKVEAHLTCAILICRIYVAAGCEGYCEQSHKGDEIPRSEEHTSELQSRGHLVCRLLLEKKK